MGVIYKLKQEIIDFIVQKKKENPSLSCRKLVDIISDVFSLHISKSSVNAIIKEHALSNPVGRASVFKAPKNFFIPQEKKDLLLAHVVPFLQEASLVEIKKEQGAVMVLATQKLPERIDDVLDKTDNAFEESAVLVKLLPDILSKSVEVMQKKRERLWENKGPLYQDVGSVFLKAALWGLSREPVLGQLLKEWAGEGIAQKRSAQEWEDLLFLSDEKTESLSKLVEEVANVPLFFLKKPIEPEAVFIFSSKKKLSIAEEVSGEISCQGLLSAASAVRVITKKKNIFRLHPGLKEVYPADDPKYFSKVPLYRTMDMVADRLINNIKPFVSKISLEGFEGERLFLALAEALEGHRDALERIEILDSNNKVLNMFESFSSEPRGYVLLTDMAEIFNEKRGGVLDHQEVFEDLVEDKDVTVWIGTVLLAGASFAVIKEVIDNDGIPRVFISNLLEQQDKREVVLKEAFAFFPYGRRECFSEMTATIVFDNAEMLEQKGVLGVFRDLLWRVSQQAFFKVKEALIMAIQLSGYVKLDKDTLFVRVVLVPEGSFIEEIKEAVRRVNESVIFDNEGRRVLVSFE